MLSLRRGMGSLVEALVDALPGGALQLDTAVESIETRGDGRWQIGLRDGTRWNADSVVLACPAWAASTLLRPLDGLSWGNRPGEVID